LLAIVVIAALLPQLIKTRHPARNTRGYPEKNENNIVRKNGGFGGKGVTSPFSRGERSERKNIVDNQKNNERRENFLPERKFGGKWGCRPKKGEEYVRGKKLSHHTSDEWLWNETRQKREFSGNRRRKRRAF